MIAIVTGRDADRYAVTVYTHKKEPKFYKWTEEQLRTKAKAGLPVAGMTDTEIVIYQDYAEFIETEYTVAKLFSDMPHEVEPVYKGNVLTGYAVVIDVDVLQSCNLEELSISESATSVRIKDDWGSVHRLPSIRRLHFPDSVDTMERGADLNFDGLQTVRLPEHWKTMPRDMFRLSSLTEIRLPMNVTKIGSECFAYSQELKSVQLSPKLKEIGKSAFSGCSALRDISLPPTLTKINAKAFEDTGLTSVKIPHSVTFIGDGAFDKCSNLVYAEIPTCVDAKASDGYDIFTACDKLQEVHVVGDDCTFRAGLFRGCQNIPVIVLSPSIETIPERAFQNSKITHIDLPPHLTLIDKDAFSFCALREITLPDSVTVIGAEAFRGGIIHSIQFSKALVAIHELAFVYCKQLQTVTLPEGLNSIGYQTFYGCKRLHEVWIPDSVTWIDRSCFGACVALKSVRLPRYLEKLPDYLFDGCTSLRMITLPERLKSIGHACFQGCTALESVRLPDGFETLECTFPKSLRELYLPDSMTDIGCLISVQDEEIFWHVEEDGYPNLVITVPKTAKALIQRLQGLLDKGYFKDLKIVDKAC